MRAFKSLLGLVITVAIFSVKPSYGHEGHDAPGALPPAPNGGRVEEAHHKVEHSEHGEEKEDEFFFEAFYKDKTLKIFPLVLPEKDPSVFRPVSPKELTKVSVRVEFPRSKRVEIIETQISGESFTGKIDPQKANRFIVYISAFHNNELKEAAIQLEKE